MSRHEPLVLALLCGASLACGCSASNALLNVGIAATVSAVQRSQGGCYSQCTSGMKCNPESGLCEPIPCGGVCRSSERCDENGLIPRCVAVQPDLRLDWKAGGASPGDATSGSPSEESTDTSSH